MLVNIKVVRGEELSVNVLETATVADLKEEISKLLSHPIAQIKLLKPTGGVLLATTLVVDIYSHPTSLKVILGVDSDVIVVQSKLLNSTSENSINFPSNTLLSAFKEKISDIHDLDISTLSFLHNGLALTRDNLTLKELKIRNGAKIILKQRKVATSLSLNICVQNSLQFSLSLPPCTPLLELKNIISSKLQKNVDNIVLENSGISLNDDNKNLKELNIQDRDTINVLYNTASAKGTVQISSNSLGQVSSCIKEKSADELQHPFFQEMDKVLTKHIPEEQDRARVMEHFCQHTVAYVNSLNLEDIEEMTTFTPSNH